MWGDLGKLDALVFTKFLSVFNLVVSVLFSIEASNSMICHWATTFLLLNESNHCCVTSRVKASVVARLNVNKLCCTILNGIWWYCRLHGVLEVGNKSLSVVQLNFKSLIIYRSPLSLHGLSVYGGSRSIVIFKWYLHCGFLGKRELEVIVDKLNSVG